MGHACVTGVILMFTLGPILSLKVQEDNLLCTCYAGGKFDKFQLGIFGEQN